MYVFRSLPPSCTVTYVPTGLLAHDMAAVIPLSLFLHFSGSLHVVRITDDTTSLTTILLLFRCDTTSLLVFSLSQPSGHCFCYMLFSPARVRSLCRMWKSQKYFKAQSKRWPPNICKQTMCCDPKSINSITVCCKVGLVGMSPNQAVQFYTKAQNTSYQIVCLVSVWFFVDVSFYNWWWKFIAWKKVASDYRLTVALSTWKYFSCLLLPPLK